ncbi:MAG: GTP-binding protein, partial [Pirellulaceae bacterium]
MFDSFCSTTLTKACMVMTSSPRFIMIGGFLGAGKTTTIARLASHFRGEGKNVAIVTND